MAPVRQIAGDVALVPVVMQYGEAPERLRLYARLSSARGLEGRPAIAVERLGDRSRTLVGPGFP